MEKSSVVKIGIVQHSCSESKDENIDKVIRLIRIAVTQGAQIICLQELFASIYFCCSVDHKNFELAEPLPGATVEKIQELAKELKIVIIVSLFEKRAQGLFHNTAAIIDADGSLLGIYRKSHIPDDPGFYEKFYFTPGDTGYKCFQTAYAKIGVLICWDQWFPEAARITALKGAEILFYPTAIGWELQYDEATKQEQYQAWQVIQRSHAIANGVHVVAVNRVGLEADTLFWGGSFVSNPFGKILYQSSHDKEDVHVVELDLSQTNKYRQIWPFLRDRRIDNYQDILKRFDD